MVVVAVVAGVVVVTTVRASLPRTSGTAELPGLTSSVTVMRDGSGIPHIFGDSLTDIARAQGYVHAQEQFFQMDLRRHITAGRLSELVGEDGVETDTVIRTLGWRRIAEEELPTLKPQTRQMLQAYADGVNTYLRGRSPREVAVEYSILGLQLPTAEIEEWSPLDSLAWLKAMAWDLKGNYDDELARARLSGRLSPAQINQIYPAYDYDAHPPILGDDEWSPQVPGRATSSSVPSALTRAATGAPADAVPAGAGRRPGHQCVGAGRLRAGARGAHLDPAARRQRWGRGVELVGGLRRAHHDRQAPARERPAPRGEPARHLDPEQPQLPHRVVGVRPRRERLLLRGRARRGDRPQRRHRVGVHQPRPRRQRLLPRAGDRRHLPARRRLAADRHPEEVIKVAGGADRRVTVRSTVHGPVLSDVIDGMSDAGSRAPTEQEGDENESYAVSLAWTGLLPGRTADAILDLNLATDFDSFREAARSFAVPAQNLLYADRQGHIGYQAPGQVPLRRPALPRAPAGYWPAPGWDSTYDWQGFVEFSEMPWALDPADGVIVAANQAVTRSATPFLTTEWDSGWRSTPHRRAAGRPPEGVTGRHGRRPARHPGLLREGARAGPARGAARGVRGRPRLRRPARLHPRGPRAAAHVGLHDPGRRRGLRRGRRLLQRGVAQPARAALRRRAAGRA